MHIVRSMLVLPSHVNTMCTPSAAMSTKRSGLHGSIPVLTPVFCDMGDAEVTSIAGSEPQMSPPMKAIPHSEVEEGEQPKRPGRGRGHGSGRGRAASSRTYPRPKRVINTSRGHRRQSKARQPKTILSWLHHPT